MKKLSTLFLTIVFSLSFLILSGCSKSGKDHHENHDGKMHITKGIHTDPVCGMKVKSSTKWKSSYKGKTYYFCMEADKKQFDSNRLKYLKKK